VESHPRPIPDLNGLAVLQACGPDPAFDTSRATVQRRKHRGLRRQPGLGVEPAIYAPYRPTSATGRHGYMAGTIGYDLGTHRTTGQAPPCPMMGPSHQFFFFCASQQAMEGKARPQAAPEVKARERRAEVAWEDSRRGAGHPGRRDGPGRSSRGATQPWRSSWYASLRTARGGAVRPAPLPLATSRRCTPGRLIGRVTRAGPGCARSRPGGGAGVMGRRPWATRGQPNDRGIRSWPRSCSITSEEFRLSAPIGRDSGRYLLKYPASIPARPMPLDRPATLHPERRVPSATSGAISPSKRRDRPSIS